MPLKALTYTSLARLDVTTDDLLAIQHVARLRNALDGISGLLIFNGTHFLQVIEGMPDAIDDLVGRLRADTRHHGLEIRDERLVEDRSFPDWSMELIRVESRYFEAQTALQTVLPKTISDEVRANILSLTEGISRSVRIPD